MEAMVIKVTDMEATGMEAMGMEVTEIMVKSR